MDEADVKHISNFVRCFVGPSELSIANQFTMTTRGYFRTPASYTAERITRDMVPGFLGLCGFEKIVVKYKGQAQAVEATTPVGESVKIRIRLCWRPRETKEKDANTYAAVQLLARVRNNDWVGELSRKIKREELAGITHFLFVKRDDLHILYAALVPISALLEIWQTQRDVSARLIEQGLLGRRRKNHAMNGASPTLWLQDDSAPDVAAALWNYPGVVDLAKQEPTRLVELVAEDADNSIDDNSAGYSPQDGDRRLFIERQIRARRGQTQFRDVLRQRYGCYCQVTGCSVLAVLEAAHIMPYRGDADNHPENGLLLRSDIHTLFDLDLLGIEPIGLTIRLHPGIANKPEYQSLNGRSLACTKNCRPSDVALRLRYELFWRRVTQPL